MKKLFLLMTLVVICVLGVSAQNTKVVTGAVIDKNGNPLPNALVEATGGAESVTTDADGSFRIEVPIWLKSLTARYAGFGDKKIKLNHRNQIIFEMKPIRGAWFLNAAGSFNTQGGEEDYCFGSFGLLVGYLGNWGGYARLLVPAVVDEDVIPSFTAGVIKRISTPFYLYLGFGYATVYGDYYNYSWGNWYLGRHNAAMFEAGAIFKFNKFNFSAGYGYSDSFHTFTRNHSVQLSLGYCFR